MGHITNLKPIPILRKIDALYLLFAVCRFSIFTDAF